MADPEALWSQAQRTGSPVVSPVAVDGTVEVTFLWRGEAEATSVGWGVWMELDRVPGRDVPIEEHTLPGGRRLAVYRPTGEPPAEGLATLVVFDGWLARTVLRIQHTLDNLIAAGLIPPPLALFVPGSEASRDTDLTPASAATTAFVTRELLPWARRELGAGAEPARTVVAGQSLGGLMAAHVALCAPEVFGAVIAQSGSFWWPKPEAGEPGRLLRDYAEQPRADLRFYLDVGDRETRSDPGEGPHMLEMSWRMRDVLTGKGYPVTYAEHHGAHDYANWRDTFADGLIAVLRPG